MTGETSTPNGLSAMSGATPSSPSLSRLVESDVYLVKILENLVADGLHECRLVCRRWRLLSQQVSVRLGLDHPRRLRDAAERFPLADTLVCGAGDSLRRDTGSVFSRGADVASGAALTEENLRRVASFRRLRVLELHCCRDGASAEAWTDCLSRLRFLKVLCLAFGNGLDHSPNRSAVLGCLPHLVGLTRLSVLCCHPMGQATPSCSRLMQLKDLSVNAELVVDASGRFAFPKATKLERLQVSFPGAGATERDVLCVLTVVLERSQSVKTLRLDGAAFLRIDGAVAEALDQFAALESVALSVTPESLRHAFGALANLPELRNLDLETEVGALKAETGLAALTRLRSLRLQTTEPLHEDVGHLLSNMTSLTRLEAEQINVEAALPNLTGLVALSLGYIHDYEDDSVVRILDALNCLTNLEELSLDCHAITGNSFSRLTKLRSLRVDCCEVDHDFVSFLSTLERLTHLRFAPRIDEVSEAAFSAIQNVTSLRRLSIEGSCSREPSVYFCGGRLVKLRYLTLVNLCGGDGERQDEIGIEERRSLLSRNFPCIRRLSYVA